MKDSKDDFSVHTVKFFLKFGKREHLERLQNGFLFFSNALTFRYYEEKLLIKGQGDRLEGGSEIVANRMTMFDPITEKAVLVSEKSKLLLHYEPANKLPVFCIFSCFEKDCVLQDDGTLAIKLSDEIKNIIVNHFPDADTVAIISNPTQFVEDVSTSIGSECKSGLVNYFRLTGFQNGDLSVNDLEYFKYLAQDTPPVKEDGKVKYSFDARYVYRSLLCKDTFFEKEQEYRLILPELSIDKGKEFFVQLSEKIKLQDIKSFFSDT